MHTPPPRREKLPLFPFLTRFFRPLLSIGFHFKFHTSWLLGALSIFLLLNPMTGRIGGILSVAWGAILMYFAMHIFDLTLGGDDSLGEWEGIDFQEGVFHLLWGLFMLFVSAVPGFMLMVACAEVIPESLYKYAGFIPLASVILLSPFCFLSGLLNESQFNPVSPELLKGIPEHIGFWLRYYLVSIVGIAVIIAGFMLSFQAAIKLDIPPDSQVWGIITGVLVAFFFSIGIFFYFRLLGRLARAIESQNYETYEPGENFEFNEDYY